MTGTDVIKFWFEECTPQQWFKKDEKFDALIKARFFETYVAVANGETKEWRATPEGRLAEIIVLDQFPRNMFRGLPESFVTDALALELAEEMVYAGDDKRLRKKMRKFAYMPYMHSESKSAHRKGLWLFIALWDWGTLKYEWEHKKIIDRFGRFPHRNLIMQRESTPEELEFLLTHKGF